MLPSSGHVTYQNPQKPAVFVSSYFSLGRCTCSTKQVSLQFCINFFKTSFYYNENETAIQVHCCNQVILVADRANSKYVTMNQKFLNYQIIYFNVDWITKAN
eukprot:TRINITY_DN81053_c0_g1_i1.p1 TRINITY_DN81053_c0_g1~~TRINITY_DN81053_c0_g1_i1.p1  ORF type:complete len:102 (+),score=3.02 TRINITY_DN81053_c0_g1_i1:128-433(+)